MWICSQQDHAEGGSQDRNSKMGAPQQPVRMKSCLKHFSHHHDINTKGGKEQSSGDGNGSSSASISSRNCSLSNASTSVGNSGTTVGFAKCPPPFRSIRFDRVHIRDYERVVGDNPSCSNGAPISIGWGYGKTRSIPVDEYESSKMIRRNQMQLVLTRAERQRLLLHWGATGAEVVESIRANIRVKNQRRRTVNNLGTYDKVEETLENVSRKLKYMLLLQTPVSTAAKRLQTEHERVAQHQQKNNYYDYNTTTSELLNTDRTSSSTVSSKTAGSVVAAAGNHRLTYSNKSDRHVVASVSAAATKQNHAFPSVVKIDKSGEVVAMNSQSNQGRKELDRQGLESSIGDGFKNNKDMDSNDANLTRNMEVEKACVDTSIRKVQKMGNANNVECSPAGIITVSDRPNLTPEQQQQHLKHYQLQQQQNHQPTQVVLNADAAPFSPAEPCRDLQQGPRKSISTYPVAVNSQQQPEAYIDQVNNEALKMPPFSDYPYHHHGNNSIPVQQHGHLHLHRYHHHPESPHHSSSNNRMHGEPIIKEGVRYNRLHHLSSGGHSWDGSHLSDDERSYFSHTSAISHTSAVSGGGSVVISEDDSIPLGENFVVGGPTPYHQSPPRSNDLVHGWR